MPEGAGQLHSARWAAGVSLSPVSEILLHSLNDIKTRRNTVRKAGYLNFRNNGASLCTGAGEGRQRGWRHDRVGAGEVAQVTAGDLVLFMSHDDGFHDKEAVPRQPEGVLLCDERCPLEPQDDGDAPICDQVKAVWEGRVERKQETMMSRRKKSRRRRKTRKEEKLHQKTWDLVEETLKPKRLHCTHKQKQSRKHYLKNLIHNREFAKTK